MIDQNRIEAILGRSKNGRWHRRPETYLRYLREALALLTPETWVGDVYARDRNGKPLQTARTKQAVKFCMLGACENTTPDYADYYTCKLLLAAAGGLNPSELGRFDLDRKVPVDGGKEVDEPKETTLRRVHDLYGVAIKSLTAVLA